MKFNKTNLLKYEIVQFMKNSILTVGSNTYVSIGRPLFWGDNASSETQEEVGEVFLSTNYIDESRRNMMVLKKVAPSDIALVVPRNDWVSGLVYEQYNDHLEMFEHEKEIFIGNSIANSNVTISGTVNVTSGSSTVSGVDTTFTTALLIGDLVTVNNQTRSVVTITDNTNLTVNSNFIFSGISNTIIAVSNNRIVKNTAGLFLGNVDVGVVVSISGEQKEVVEVKGNYAFVVNTKISTSQTEGQTIKLVNRYPLFANNFFARNSRDQVFKCLYTPKDQNDNLIVSTIEPTIDIDGQLPEDPYIETGDLYKWKYLYTIPYGLKQKFFTSKWMPVVTDNSVLGSSVDGRIDVIDVTNQGSGYYLNGQSGNNASYPIVTITGDGTGATATAQVESGQITELNILSGGRDYTKANVTISDPFQLAEGTSASFDVVIGPPGGHGSNPAKELGCYTFMISVELNTDDNKIPVSGAAYGGNFDF